MRLQRMLAGATAVLLLLTVALALAGASLLPGIARKYYLLLPGAVFPVAPALEIPTERRQDAGDLNYAVVYEAEADLPAALAAAARPGVRVVPYEEIIPSGTTPEQSTEVNKKLMSESQTAAAVVALRKAGYQVSFGGDGVRIAEVVAGRPAAEKLKVGDVVLAQDGVPVRVANDLINEIRKHRPGDEVELTVQRGGETVQIRVGTVAAPGGPGEPERAVVGALIDTVNFRADLPFPVKIGSGDVIGPSAGLMFALGIYDAVTPGVIGGGRKVAGTGTISQDGQVGPVDGAAQKVLGAAQAGAVVFLVPRENLKDALSTAPASIRVIPVGTFDDALAALAALD
jgi:PDZ domain-containing protein